MLLIGELLPWSLFSKGRNLGACTCPVLVIWGLWGPSGKWGLMGPLCRKRGSEKPAKTQWVLLPVCSRATMRFNL